MLAMTAVPGCFKWDVHHLLIAGKAKGLYF